MNHQKPPDFDKDALEDALTSTDEKYLCDVLLSIALHHSDWEWAQNKCLEKLKSKSPGVRGLAATCLGHIARIHGKLDRGRVVSTLMAHLSDGLIAGQVEDALEDIGIFLD